MRKSVMPEIAPRGRYGTSEAARLLGIHRNTLRNYTNAGLIQKRQGNALRSYYLGSDLEKLWRML